MKAVVLSLLLITSAIPASAQMSRQRSAPAVPDEMFWAPTVILSESVTQLPAGNVNFSIMHAFGPVSQGADDLFGLDGTANIRFGLDYGITDRLSVGVGRSRFDKQFDFRFKATLVPQTSERPIAVAVKGDAGIATVKNGFEPIDRLNYFGGLLLAARVSDALTVQVTPMVGHYNTVFITLSPGGDRVEELNTQIGLGIAARYMFSDRLAVLAEVIPVLSGQSDGTVVAAAAGIDIETGGHVFQLYLSTSDWLTEQATMARNTEQFLDGDFRFGFTVNRVFAVR